VLIDALRRVHDGETVVDPTIVASLLGRRRRQDPLARLTERERQVLSLIAEGLSNHAIATRLSVTDQTVEAHNKQIFIKLGLKRRTFIVASSLCSHTSRPDAKVSGGLGPVRKAIHDIEDQCAREPARVSYPSIGETAWRSRMLSLCPATASANGAGRGQAHEFADRVTN
jgi:DNA-binding CsgD family transcriptional regulator